MKHRRGRILLDGVDVGILSETEEGYVFAYSIEWQNKTDARPISLTMPVRSDAYISKNLHPFFQNLLPEGWLLELATKKLKVSKDDAFGLLLATCADCIGVVEILPIENEGDV